MGSLEQLRVFAIGRVQGVFMRAYTTEEAKKLHLTGWCRNINDGERAGQVEIVAEGPRENLEKLLAWVEAGGSPSARVDRVEVSYHPASGQFSDFGIVRRAQ